MSNNPPTPKQGLGSYSNQANPQPRIYTGGALNLPQQNGLQAVGKSLVDAAGGFALLQKQQNDLTYQRQAFFLGPSRHHLDHFFQVIV